MQHQACQPLISCNQVNTDGVPWPPVMRNLRTPDAAKNRHRIRANAPAWGHLFPDRSARLTHFECSLRKKRWCILRFAQLILQCAMFMVETRAGGFAFLKCPAVAAALNESSIHPAAG
jgi:hypothetical protein